ncbi:hypothetical protein M422DRAFT_52515 [Sphaerobolus stellatus SS14]|uniref:NB-ARC domain-containing protein n=1 Tax=Sphaerobolus stellatus (strain SS14) TaxID=990650 RepID=A0A0C9UEF1_SPHS4|nr:hypothetical protein M422DRAFT_52515 [Sphaerobolus stellatus SS14]
MDQVSVGINKVDTKVDTILDLLKPGQAHSASNGMAVWSMPLKPANFYGRDDVVNDTARLLIHTETSRECLLEPGGMGKTSVALAIMESRTIQERFESTNRFWIPRVEAPSPSPLLDILFSHLRRNTKAPLDDITYELEVSEDPRILLFDNWDPVEGSYGEVIDILRRISRIPQVALLMTMRGTTPPDVDLNRLLTTLGHMPFAVTLMAKLTRESRTNAKELLDDSEHAGTGMLSGSDDRERSMNRSISLSVDSKLVKQDPDALPLLAALSMLPAGTTRNHLHWWAPENLSSGTRALATLSKTTLVVVSDTGPIDSVISVLPVVQSYMRSDGRILQEIQQHITNACYKFIRSYNSTVGDTNFNSDLKTLACEETNLQYILLGGATTTSNSSSLKPTMIMNERLDALLSLSWYHVHTNPRSEVAERTLKLARDLGDESYIAKSLLCLGRTYNVQGHYEEAYRHLQEEAECMLEMSEAIGFRPPEDDIDLRLALKAQAILEKLEGSNTYAKARAKLLIGSDFHMIHDLESPLENLEDLEKVYYDMGRFKEGLDNCEQGIREAEYTENEYQLADALHIASIGFIYLNLTEEALKYSERAPLACKRSGGYPQVSAAILELMGFIYLERMDLSTARIAYKVATDHAFSLIGKIIWQKRLLMPHLSTLS